MDKILRLLAVLALVLVVVAQADAQERAGVVTTLEGHVTVMRAALTEPVPLRFKDDIFVKDRIATGGSSAARILLAGRAVVTIREHSVVTITEVPGVSTVDVVAGRAAVAVAREKMRAGDLVEVKTPNAVAGIRGTVVVAEVFDAHSVITVLKGVVDVKRLDGGRLVGTPIVLSALHRLTVTDGRPLPRPQSVPPDAAKNLGREFRLAPPPATPSAATAAVNEGELERAATHLATIAPPPATNRRGRERGPEMVRTGDRDDHDGDEDAAEVIRRDAGRKRELAEKLRRKVAEPERERGRDRSEASLLGGSGRSVPSVSSLGAALKTGSASGRKNRDRDD